MNRLTRRQKLVIGGCVFAAIAIGIACTGQAQAATIDLSVTAAASHFMVGSSDLTWAASSGDMAGIPPLGIGQEVITGGYHEALLLSGPAQYRSRKTLNNSEIINFNTGKDLQSTGPGLYEESLMLFSTGSAAAGVTCGGTEGMDQEGANFTAIPYYERLIASTTYMADQLTYHSEGSISQADLETPDAMDFTVISNGSGLGTFTVDGMSISGIGNTTELGYVNAVHESMTVGGQFELGGEVRWTSFREAFDVPEIEIRE
jgi:hypothetical protein